MRFGAGAKPYELCAEGINNFVEQVRRRCLLHQVEVLFTIVIFLALFVVDRRKDVGRVAQRRIGKLREHFTSIVVVERQFHAKHIA